MFHEEWFGVASQQVLADAVRSVAHLDGLIVEIGVWQGRSTVALALAAWPETVHAVDTWAGSPGEVSARLAARRDVYAEFEANVEALTKGNVKSYQMSWQQWFDGNTHPVKFLHIDAAHTYDQVKGNIDAALPFIVSGGIICGDDVHHEPVHRAVLETLAGVVVKATEWIWEKPTERGKP